GRVDGRDPGRIHLDDLGGDRGVGRLVRDGRLDHDHPHGLRVDADARQLAQAERRGLQGVQDERDAAIEADDGGRPLVVVPPAAAFARRTASSGEAHATDRSLRTSHIRSARASAVVSAMYLMPSATAITLGPMHGTSAYWNPPITLTDNTPGRRPASRAAAISP